MQLTSEEEKLWRIFQPQAFERINAALDDMRPTRFVHYTNAEAAMSILRGKEVWMRKAICMNDYTEVQHGLDCLYEAYKSSELKSVLETLFSGFATEMESLFNGWTPAILWHTYLTCLSEHLDDENDYGRLSMWRAYGENTGIALVLNGKQVLDAPEPIEAIYTVPVDYSDGQKFEAQLKAVVEDIKANAEFIRSMGKEEIKGYVFQMLKFAAVCTKHPGFNEEKEWRIVYFPQIENTLEIRKEIKTIGGHPQPIFKIPIKNLPALLERIIIGPTQHATSIWEAFVDTLISAGVENPTSKVIISNIPLRR